MTTLKEALGLLKYIPFIPKKNTAEGLLGKYKGIIPKRKSSGSFIRNQRGNLCGKIK